MSDFRYHALHPLYIAGLLPILAVGISLYFVEAEGLWTLYVLLAAFASAFISLPFLLTRQAPLRVLSCVVGGMLLIALMVVGLAPTPGPAPVLLVIWAAVAFGTWPPLPAALLIVLGDVAFFLLLPPDAAQSPWVTVILYAGFQVLAALCMYYALSAQHSRNELLHVNADLLATRVLLADSARDTERLRLARELHDVAGHKLTALRLNLRAAAFRESPQKEQLQLAEQLSGELLADIRHVVQALRDDQGIDLESALHALAVPFPRPRLRIQMDGEIRVANPEVAETILRLVQEALTNAARHTNADEILVRISCTNGLRIHIQDNGRIRGELREGNGIAGMRERIAHVDGSLELGATADRSLWIEVRIPT